MGYGGLIAASNPPFKSYNRHIVLPRTVILLSYTWRMERNMTCPLWTNCPKFASATISVHDAIESAPVQVRGHISLFASASVHFLAPTTDSVSAAMQILDAANILKFI